MYFLAKIFFSLISFYFSFLLLYQSSLFASVYSINDDPYGFKDQYYLNQLLELQKKYANNNYNKDFLTQKSLLYYNLKRYEKALKSLKEAEIIYPKDLDIKLLLARVYLKLKDFDVCESYLIKIIQLNSQFYDVYLLYGDFFFEKGIHDEAIIKYNHALGINHYIVYSYIKLAMVYFKIGDLEKSLSFYKKAENIDYRNPDLNFSMGLYYYELKDYENCLYYLTNVMIINPGYSYAKVLLYRVLFHLKHFQQAKDTLEDLLLEKNHPKLYYDLALVFEELKQPEFSLKNIFSAIQQDPENEVYEIFAEQIYLKFYKDYPEMESYGKKIAEILRKKAFHFYERNNIDLALLFFNRSLKLDSKNLNANKAILKMYKHKGYISEYFNHLVYMKDLGFEEHFIDVEIQFMNKIIPKLISKRYQLSDQDKKMSSKILILPFNNQLKFGDYYRLSDYYFHFFLEVLKNYLLFDVEYLSEKEMKNVNYNEYDFILQGNLLKEGQKDGDLFLDFKILNSINQDQYKVLETQVLPLNKISETTFNFTRKLKNKIPIVGKVILKTSKNQFIVNLGRSHGYKEGDSFYFIPSKDIIHHLVWLENEDNVLDNNYQKVNLILEYYNKFKLDIIQELELVEINKNFSLAILNTLDFQNLLDKGGYVIYKSSNKTLSKD